jgi:hypothetical protein
LWKGSFCRLLNWLSKRFFIGGKGCIIIPNNKSVAVEKRSRYLISVSNPRTILEVERMADHFKGLRQIKLKAALTHEHIQWVLKTKLLIEILQIISIDASNLLIDLIHQVNRLCERIDFCLLKLIKIDVRASLQKVSFCLSKLCFSF